MDVLEWVPAMELGHPALDEAHKALFHEMMRLYVAPDSELAEGLPLLCDKLERDFREEEDLMEAMDAPHMKEHREQHARVLSALHHVEAGEPAAAREAVMLLPQWFQLHLATMDRSLAAFASASGMQKRENGGYATL
ncbi:bacteriohemerythrin [Massilia sp. GCM10020059]|uniref:Hemerythrin family protein n=1 Tax=Massilia agrisoli TaxID=2892444 RepID=A0ABS8J0C7_9BURK|nr:hemerythrin family protein [Massilia agrisoli]MCC6072919.1 hemerythrin family protein [Massilia agrisoli]